MSYYVTTPDLLRERRAPPGPRLHDVAADVLARHMRQRGEDVFFLTGTDEHGEPVAQAAERLRASRRASWPTGTRCASSEVAERINATNDFFIRTSDPEHAAVVAEVVTRLKDNGHVYEGTYEGWYCPRCADFKTDAELLDGNRCPIHLIELEREQRGQLVLPPLGIPGAARAAVRRAPRCVLPGHALQRGALVHQGRPAATSRSAAPGITWGVPVPWDPDAGGLRLDRRAPQLLLGALIRARGRGPHAGVLARRRPPHRQGHPQVPRGLLARPAHGGRPRGPRAPATCTATC